VLTATPVARVEGRSGESVRVHATHGVIEGIGPLWWRAARRRTPTASAWRPPGYERDDRGFIKVDERLRTTAAGVLRQWAIAPAAPISHTSPTTMSA